MKNYVYSFSVIFFLLLSACASTQDVEKTQRELAEQTDDFKSKMENIDNEIRSLQSQTELLSIKIKDLTEGTAVIRQSEADKGADITSIGEMIQTLTGRIDMLQKDTTDIKSDTEKLNTRISFMEKYLDIGDRKAMTIVPDSDGANNLALKGKTDSDTAYEIAFNSFKEEKFAKARSEFETYLTLYPDKEKAANASYWIGECFYFEGNYNQAISSFDRVVKNYSTSDKVPYALLKEGLCFYKLGDKVTAKLLFQQVTQSYPTTDQARIVQKKIQEME